MKTPLEPHGFTDRELALLEAWDRGNAPPVEIAFEKRLIAAYHHAQESSPRAARDVDDAPCKDIIIDAELDDVGDVRRRFIGPVSRLERNHRTQWGLFAASLGLVAALTVGAIHSSVRSESHTAHPKNRDASQRLASAGRFSLTTASTDVDHSRDVARDVTPSNVLYREGKLYVADFDNAKIRLIDTTSHETTTLVDQPGFRRPFALAFAPDGTLYISTDDDASSSQLASIWQLAPGTTTAERIVSHIDRPRGLAVLPDGRLAVTDDVHHVVELIDPRTDQVRTLAGGWNTPGFADGRGSDARFAAPSGIAVRSDGALVIADIENHRIRVVTPTGIVTTLAGTGTPGFADGDADAAMFHRPRGVTIASNGDIFVTELGNDRIRRISDGSVQTVARADTAGIVDQDGSLAAQLYDLEGISVVPDGSMLYIAVAARGEAGPYSRIRQLRLW